MKTDSTDHHPRWKYVSQRKNLGTVEIKLVRAKTPVSEKNREEKVLFH